MSISIRLSENELKTIRSAINDYAFLGQIGCGCRMFGFKNQLEAGHQFDCEKCKKLESSLVKSIREKLRIEIINEDSWRDDDSPQAETTLGTRARRKT